MAEFGENLKRVREEKGITQQTLADYLYVTRQAVSRWEGGSRYPDIMTAKKISQYLEVSLDDLLSDDDMKLYVEKNAILDSPIAKRVQMLLITLAFMCALASTIMELSYHFIPATVSYTSNDMIMSALLTLVLGYGVYAAVKDNLNPKHAAGLCTYYFGANIVMCVVALAEGVVVYSVAYMVGAIVLDVFMVAVGIRFFLSKSVKSPLPIYIVFGLNVIAAVVSKLINISEFPTEYFRDAFLLDFFGTFKYLMLFFLLVAMAYMLDKKRKRAAR